MRIIVFLTRVLTKIFRHMDNAYIFMFHHVAEENSSGISRQIFLHEAGFRRMIQTILDKKIRVVPIDEVFESIGQSDFDRYVCLTFDDGFDNTYTTAYPILKEYNLPFTVFVTTDYIGKPGYMTFSQLQELSRSPLCTIGSHTISHSVLKSAGRGNEIHEIRGSKEMLEKLLGKEVRYFAYPYGGLGKCSLSNIRTVKRSGYRLGFSTLPKGLNRITSKNRYYLPRFNVCGITTERVIDVILASMH